MGLNKITPTTKGHPIVTFSYSFYVFFIIIFLKNVYYEELNNHKLNVREKPSIRPIYLIKDSQIRSKRESYYFFDQHIFGG